MRPALWSTPTTSSRPRNESGRGHVDLTNAFASGCPLQTQGREVNSVKNRGSILQVLIVISALLGLFAVQAAKSRQGVLTSAR